MSRRVQSLAAQWQPAPPPRAGADAGADAGKGLRGLDALGPNAEPDDPWRRAVLVQDARWSRPAIRALLAVITACLAVAAWWWWSGRPHEVITASPAVVLATGDPVTGVSPAASAPSGSVPVAPTPQVMPAAAGAWSPVSPSSESPSPSATPSDPVAPDLVVHVSGDVARPGIVQLAPGSRVADAVAAAGGVTRRRAADSVNLARPVVDGEQIVVDADVPAASRPAQGGPSPAGGAGTSAPVEGGGAPGSVLGGTVGAPLVLDLNVADAAALETLPGVGPVLAGRIVQWRADNGSFTSVDELGEVSGIGDAILARLRPLVRV